MWRRLGRAALAAGLAFQVMPAWAGEGHVFESAPVVQGLTFETSMRARLAWTEIAYRGNRPKAWDHIESPELRTSFRLLADMFECKVELAALSDRFETLSALDSDTLRAEVQAGINTGRWSVLAEWKPRDVFEPGIGDFLVGLNLYDLRVRNRFSVPLIDGARPAQFQAQVAAGYVASTPDIYARNFVEAELEVVQRFEGGFALTLAPKLELSDYTHFPGAAREDAVLSLRVIPAYDLGGGFAVSVEGQATVAFSTRETKIGETWALTPILKFQKTL